MATATSPPARPASPTTGSTTSSPIVEPDPRHARTVVPPYSRQEYADDLARVTGGRNDPALTAVLVAEADGAVRWLHGLGMRYRLMYERQAYEGADGRLLFFGGLHVGNVDGGVGLMADHTRIAERLGVEVRYGTRATDLVTDDGRVVGVRAVGTAGPVEVGARSVVLAAGGFEADADLRRRHLGPGWERARVRGTPLNTGDMIAAATRIGAATSGDWSGAHSVQWDAHHGSAAGDRQLTNRLTRQSYPLGILVNADGERFVDEGADFRNYTYARYGRAVLEQPGGVAYQLFDATTRPLLRTEEYDMPGVSVETADTDRRARPAARDRAATPGGDRRRVQRQHRRQPSRSTRPSRTVGGPRCSCRRATGRWRSRRRRSTPSR